MASASAAGTNSQTSGTFKAKQDAKYVITTHRIVSKSVICMIGGDEHERHYNIVKTFLENSININAMVSSFKNHKNAYGSTALIGKLVETYEVLGIEGATAALRSILLSESLRLPPSLADLLEDRYRDELGPVLLLKESGLRELALLQLHYPSLDCEALFPGELKSLCRDFVTVYTTARNNPVATEDLKRAQLFAADSMADLELSCLQICEMFGVEIADNQAHHV